MDFVYDANTITDGIEKRIDNKVIIACKESNTV